MYAWRAQSDNKDRGFFVKPAAIEKKYIATIQSMKHEWIVGGAMGNRSVVRKVRDGATMRNRSVVRKVRDGAVTIYGHKWRPFRKEARQEPYSGELEGATLLFYLYPRRYSDPAVDEFSPIAMMYDRHYDGKYVSFKTIARWSRWARDGCGVNL